MGRGQTGTDNLNIGTTSRGSAVQQILSEKQFMITRKEFIDDEFNLDAVGELVELNNGSLTASPSQLALTNEDPALAIKGLAKVKSVSFLNAEKKYKVEFYDEMEAMVVLVPPMVALSGGQNSPQHIHAALYAAQAHAARIGKSGSPERKALAKASSIQREMPTDEQALRDLANAAVAYNQSLDYEAVDINDPEMLQALEPEKGFNSLQDELNGDSDQDFIMQQISKAMNGPNPDMASRALLYAVNEETNDVELPLDLFSERREAAKRLGGEHLIPDSHISTEQRPKKTGEYDKNGDPIYETDANGDVIMEDVSVGEFHLTSQVKSIMEQWRYNVVEGDTGLVIMRSDPGQGKNAITREIGAQMGMPVMEVNFGPSYDVNDALGSEGLGPAEVFEETTRPKQTGQFNEDGSPIYETDKNGNIVSETISEFKGSATTSRQTLGPITRYAKEPCIIVMNEPEGIEDTLVQMNEAFGSQLGDRTQRYLSPNSSSGDASHSVHPDCIFVLTYNPGPNEIQMPPSVHSRALNIHMDPLSEEEDAEKLASMVSKVMKGQRGCPGIARDFTADEVMPFVRIRKHLQNLHRTQPQDYISLTDDRQAALMFNTLMKSAYYGQKNAISTMTQTQRFLLPGNYNMTPEERDSKLREALQDQYTDLQNLASLAKEAKTKHEGA
jgi:hypothetical protein